MSRHIRTYALPIAMLAGVLSHNFVGHIAFLTPYLLFVMLLVAYCKLSLCTLRLSPMYYPMIVIQVVLCWAVYGILYAVDPVVAEGAFICIFCPTATSAPVVASMLGGNLSMLVSYSLLSNLAVAIFSPVFFSFVGVHTNMEFVDSLWMICRQVLPLLLLPLLISYVLERYFPHIRSAIQKRQNISFYLWTVALYIVVGQSVNFVIEQPLSYLGKELMLAFVALLCCVGQFISGRKIGKKYGDAVSGAQGLGQKNTVLAIWLALNYLHPVASIAPASYVIWQNIINSAQLMYKERKDV